MNELLDSKVKSSWKDVWDLKQAIHGVERALVWVGLVLTVGVLVLMSQVLNQANEIKSLQKQVQDNRESVLHNADVDKRQEVILSKLNQEYQMKHAKKGGQNDSS